MAGLVIIFMLLRITSHSFIIDFKKIISSLLYILLPLSLSLYLVRYNKPDYRPDILLIILIFIWIYDSLAYLTGVLFGKHKILPSVSPKKTWEGFAGGLIFTIIAAWLVALNNSVYSTSQWITISLIIVIAGTSGDFFESFLKRKAGVKDSGKCLPGHGGILDRFDSYLFIIPVVFIYVKWII
jgi:phosphatidate cytidylyltransferase